MKIIKLIYILPIFSLAMNLQVEAFFGKKKKKSSSGEPADVEKKKSLPCKGISDMGIFTKAIGTGNFTIKPVTEVEIKHGIKDSLEDISEKKYSPINTKGIDRKTDANQKKYLLKINSATQKQLNEISKKSKGGDSSDDGENKEHTCEAKRNQTTRFKTRAALSALARCAQAALYKLGENPTNKTKNTYTCTVESMEDGKVTERIQQIENKN